MIRVLLAEDHPVVRTGLEELLGSEDDVEVVGSVGNGEEAVAAFPGLAPDVILLDISMPELNGIEAARKVLELDPDARIVILTASSERAQIVDAIGAGALGYLLKDSSPVDLIDGIRAAARGEAPLDPKVARELLVDRRTSRPAELTDRESEVLSLVGQGLANKVIAQRLGISEKTVKAHLTRVYERIGVSDRTQAALWAERHGLAAGEGA